MLNWVKRFNIFCFLDSNQYKDNHSEFEWLLACAPVREIILSGENSLDELNDFYGKDPSWLFGHLGFGLQRQTEQVEDDKAVTIDFGDGYFFEPGIIISLDKNGELRIETNHRSPEEIFDVINNTAIENISTPETDGLAASVSQKEYEEKIERIKYYIGRGYFYELNYCYEYAGKSKLEPLSAWISLNKLSPNPFAAFYRLNNKYCICASPERFFKIENDTVISQPIKGTARRNLNDEAEDVAIAKTLHASEKNRSENIMVVDLVRNDLAKVAEQNSVEVESLCEVKPFPHLYHLVSTVAAKLKLNKNFVDVVKAAFPMGSMTGAPKRKVLEITRELETSGRGLYSGSIGYIKPNGDADFNVVIRSLFYDEQTSAVSFWVGGGITTSSEPKHEYEETLTKALALFDLLGVSNGV